MSKELSPDDSRLYKELARSYDWAVDAVVSAVQEDHTRQMENARKTGGNVSFRNDRIIHGDLQERAAQSIYLAHDDAVRAINAEIDKQLKAIAEPPTDEEARYIPTVAARDDMTRLEVEAGLMRYKGHAAQHTIRASAIRSGLKDYSAKSSYEARVDMLHALRASVDREIEYLSIIGGDSSKQKIVKANFMLLLENGGREPSIEELNAILGGTPGEE